MKRSATSLLVLLVGGMGLLWLGPLSARDAATESTPVLTAGGLAPVRLGMTIAVAQRLLRARLGRLSRSSHGFSNEPEATVVCWLWQRRDGQSPHLTYMTEHGRIVRIDISNSATAEKLPVTAHGIGLASRLDDVKKAYGLDLHLEPHPLEEGTNWAVVERNGSGGIRLEIRNNSVVGMFTAQGAALDYSEGCS